MRQRWLILTFIILVLIIGFFQIAVPTCLHERAGCLGYAVIPASAPTAPGLYRVLWSGVETLVAPNIPQNDPRILLVDTLMMLVCVCITIPMLYIWLNRWCEPDRALSGVILFGVLYLSAFHWFFRGGGIPIEVALVCLALAFIDRSWLLFIPLVVIGSLNRETSFVLVGIYAAYHWRTHWREAAALAVLWAVITGGLHLVLGGAVHQTGGLVGTIEYNIGTLSNGLISNLIFIPLAVMTLLAYRSAPPILRRLAWVASGYLAAIIVGGAWEESGRLLLPLLPLIMPLVITNRYSLTNPLMGSPRT